MNIKKIANNDLTDILHKYIVTGPTNSEENVPSSQVSQLGAISPKFEENRVEKDLFKDKSGSVKKQQVSQLYTNIIENRKKAKEATELDIKPSVNTHKSRLTVRRKTMDEWNKAQKKQSVLFANVKNTKMEKVHSKVVSHA